MWRMKKEIPELVVKREGESNFQNRLIIRRFPILRDAILSDVLGLIKTNPKEILDVMDV